MVRFWIPLISFRCLPVLSSGQSLDHFSASTRSRRAFLFLIVDYWHCFERSIRFRAFAPVVHLPMHCPYLAIKWSVKCSSGSLASALDENLYNSTTWRKFIFVCVWLATLSTAYYFTSLSSLTSTSLGLGLRGWCVLMVSISAVVGSYLYHRQDPVYLLPPNPRVLEIRSRWWLTRVRWRFTPGLHYSWCCWKVRSLLDRSILYSMPLFHRSPAYAVKRW